MADIRFRGNTFILLLIRSATDTLSSTPGFGQKGDGITRPNMLLDLLRFVDPDFSPYNSASFRQAFPSYLNGTRASSKTYFPFKDEEFRDRFDRRMKTEKPVIEKQAYDYCMKFISDDDYKRKYLVAGIIEAIKKDDSIVEHYLFNTGYGEYYEDEFDKISEVNLPDFILSVWYFLVKYKYNVGDAQGTYAAWTDYVESKADEIVTRIGRATAEKYKVTCNMPNEKVSASAGEDNGRPEKIEGEVINDTEEEKSKEENKTPQYGQPIVIGTNYGIVAQSIGSVTTNNYTNK